MDFWSILLILEPDKLSDDSTVLFIRRWHPNTTTIGKLEEICVPNRCSFTEFRKTVQFLSIYTIDYRLIK